MQVAVRELKGKLSSWLARARDGETLEITSHRKVIARIQGVPEIPSGGIAALLASDAAQWQGGKPAGAKIRLAAGGHQISEIVLQERG